MESECLKYFSIVFYHRVRDIDQKDNQNRYNNGSQSLEEIHYAGQFVMYLMYFFRIGNDGEIFVIVSTDGCQISPITQKSYYFIWCHRSFAHIVDNILCYAIGDDKSYRENRIHSLYLSISIQSFTIHAKKI